MASVLQLLVFSMGAILLPARGEQFTVDVQVTSPSEPLRKFDLVF